MIGDAACTTLRHTTMFTYSHANTPLGQSERAHYLSYFINYSSNYPLSFSLGAQSFTFIVRDFSMISVKEENQHNQTLTSLLIASYSFSFIFQLYDNITVIFVATFLGRGAGSLLIYILIILCLLSPQCFTSASVPLTMWKMIKTYRYVKMIVFCSCFVFKDPSSSSIFKEIRRRSRWSWNEHGC